MKRLILLLVAMSASLPAQTVSVHLRALNGKTGKPLPKQRLVIFGGLTPEDVRFHVENFDLTTDDRGIAILSVDEAKVRWIQVFADFLTLCQDKPNSNAFELKRAVAVGLSTPNDCGRLHIADTPGTVTIFARASTLWEGLSR